MSVKWIMRLFCLFGIGRISLSLFHFYELRSFCFIPKIALAIVCLGLSSGWSVQANREFCRSISSATWSSHTQKTKDFKANTNISTADKQRQQQLDRRTKKQPIKPWTNTRRNAIRCLQCRNKVGISCELISMSDSSTTLILCGTFPLLLLLLLLIYFLSLYFN